MTDAAPAIRAAGRDDADVLLGLYAELDGWEDVRCTPDTIERFFQRLACYPDYHLYLMEVAGQALGTYALLILDNLGHGGLPLAIVESVVVARRARGRGLGRRMMLDARDRARAAGCYKLMLSSNLKRAEAHAFYDALGFERHGYSFRVTP